VIFILFISRHFRTETVEVVTIKGSKDDNRALFSDLMETDEGEDNLWLALTGWVTGTIIDRTAYYKVLPHKTDDLTYYLVIHVVRCRDVSFVVIF
jgi:hypothetical protein